MTIMENLLNHYAIGPEPGVVRLCLDERPCQLLSDIKVPLPMKPGQSRRPDYEYKRMGTCCIFLAYDRDNGKRYMQVRAQRTRKDYAEFIDWLRKEHFPHATRIEIVQDNLNTHNYKSFHVGLEPDRAKELEDLIAFTFTPKHASWLNMAEIEFSVLSRQCLNRRISTMEELEKEVLAWQARRNELCELIHWSFTVDKAREKFSRLLLQSALP